MLRTIMFGLHNSLRKPRGSPLERKDSRWRNGRYAKRERGHGRLVPDPYCLDPVEWQHAGQRRAGDTGLLWFSQAPLRQTTLHITMEGPARQCRS